MKRLKQLVMTLTLLLSTLAYAENVELSLKDGSVWTGSIGQTVTVTYKKDGVTKYEGELTRATKSYIIVANHEKTPPLEMIFINKIISISGDVIPEPKKNSEIDSAIADTETIQDSMSKIETKMGELPRGVFVLPLTDTVGTYFRDTEITRLVEYVEEKYGLGQTIVLLIDSGGGYIHIWEKIRQAIYEARPRHRFIAWIDNAGSAAAATAYLCDEIYYLQQGYVGAATMYAGSIENPAPDWQQDGWARELAKVLAHSSHTPWIGGCMIRSKYNFSYDIDPETGEITYHPNEHGEEVLSKTGRNMILSAGEALACGLSDGTADDGEQLAALLDLEEWIEIDSFGRDIAADWIETLKEFEVEGPKLMRQFQGDVEATEPRKILSARIKAGLKILKWHDEIGEETWPLVSNRTNIEAIKLGIKDLKHQQRYLED